MTELQATRTTCPPQAALVSHSVHSNSSFGPHLCPQPTLSHPQGASVASAQLSAQRVRQSMLSPHSGPSSLLLTAPPQHDWHGRLAPVHRVVPRVAWVGLENSDVHTKGSQPHLTLGP